MFSQLEHKASLIPVGSDGVTVSTYLSVCMDPHLNSNAHGAFMGLKAHQTQSHLYRASLEALTLESTRALQAMISKGVKISQINVSYEKCR